MRPSTTLTIAALAASGCMNIEAAATYYPVVDGGPRVAGSGYGFAVNIGFGLTTRRVHASVARGFEIAAARYSDPTGKGSVGHLSPWAARLDYQAKHLGGKAWADATVGGTWGKGVAAVEYDDGVVMNGAEGANNPKVTASTWSLFAGPSLHIDGSREFDFFLTAAATTMHSTSAAFDDFSAHGVTFRLQFNMGPDPGPLNIGTGIGTLFRRGYDAEEAQRRFQRDQADFNRRQGDLKDQERERQDRERRDRERECQGGAIAEWAGRARARRPGVCMCRCCVAVGGRQGSGGDAALRCVHHDRRVHSLRRSVRARAGLLGRYRHRVRPLHRDLRSGQ